LLQVSAQVSNAMAIPEQCTKIGNYAQTFSC